MLHASVTDEVLSCLAACARTDEVWRDLDLELFEQHLLDSLAVVELLVQLSERLDLDLSPSEFDRDVWATPRKIIAYLSGRLAFPLPG
ncbi:MAG: D-alanine--poly(phosphoribitol) ligase subunit DltC [Chloroflexi bacterium]|nr:D-alanine--poly(phosphoribitol) ligase subunit DltC [Chloroflexota bacterium]MBV9596041.1 D-alanine--poly(phosphoribitol) ligase subunit DltC [Chloroflexota bacterium]